MKRSTLGLVAFAILFGGGIYIYDTVIAPQQEKAKADRQTLFTFKPEDIQGLKITGSTPVRLERRAKPESSEPKWELREPEVINASDGAVAFLTSLFSRSNPEAPTDTPSNRRPDFGLDRPLGTVEITLKNKSIHRLVLGKPTFDNSALYAEVDPGKGATFKLYQVAPEFSPAIGRPLAEWKYTAEFPASPSASPKATTNGTPGSPIEPTTGPAPGPAPTGTPTPTP
jgi:hypothetical protein